MAWAAKKFDPEKYLLFEAKKFCRWVKKMVPDNYFDQLEENDIRDN